MPTYIEVKGLRVYAHHGVEEQERKVGNEFEVSVRLEYPCTEAMVSDNISATLNYADVISLIADVMDRPANLLENVVYRIHSELMRKYPQIEGGVITVVKLHPPIRYEIESAGFTYAW